MADVDLWDESWKWGTGCRIDVGEVEEHMTRIDGYTVGAIIRKDSSDNH